MDIFDLFLFVTVADALIAIRAEQHGVPMPIIDVFLFLAGVSGLIVSNPAMLEFLKEAADWSDFVLCAVLTLGGVFGVLYWRLQQLRPDLAQAPLSRSRLVRSAENRWAVFGLIYWLVVFGLGLAARWSSLPHAAEIVMAFGILGYILIPWLGIPRTIAKWEKK